MSQDTDKKQLKAEAKTAKKAAKAEVKIASASAAGGVQLPDGVTIDIRVVDDRPELVVSGLDETQLRQIAPQITRDVVIETTAQRSPARAALLRFVREGVFQTIIKVVAGLIVAWVLLSVGAGR